MKRYSLLLVFQLFIGHLLFGQTATIKGKIISSGNKSGVPFSTVQFLGKALGASADANGKFIIANVPLGIQQIKVSSVGYETYYDSIDI